MNKLYLLTICLLLSFNMKAQQGFISLPDSVGKYLFDFFIHKADLSQSQIIIDDDEYSDTKYDWAKLTKWIDVQDLDAQSTTYYKTCFMQRSVLNDVSFPTEIYVAMKHDENIFAFRAIVQWLNDHWVINNVDTDFYVYFEEGDVSGLMGFISLSDQDPDYFDEGAELMYDADVDEGEPIIDTVYIADDSNLNVDSAFTIGDSSIPMLRTAFESSVDISQPIRIPLPVNFSANLLGLILQEAPYGDREVFFTRHEYLDTKGAYVLKRLEKLLDSEVDLGEERDPIERIAKYPGLLFEELIANWESFPKNLKEEFGDINLGDLRLDNIEMEIENWDTEKSEIDMPLISATINIPLSDGNKKAGIYYSAIWYNGAWKLSHIQQFPYGIESAEAVTASKDDIEL